MNEHSLVEITDMEIVEKLFNKHKLRPTAYVHKYVSMDGPVSCEHIQFKGDDFTVVLLLDYQTSKGTKSRWLIDNQDILINYVSDGLKAHTW